MGGQPAVDPHLVLPLVLQVFPLPGSSDLEEFHGGPHSCLDLVGINVALFSHLAILLRFGGHGLHYGPHLQHVRSSPALRMGNVPYDYGGFFRTATPPHNYGYYHHGHGSPPAHNGGHLSAQVSPSVHGGRHAPPRDLPSFVYGGGTFPQGHGGYARMATSVAPSLAFAGSSLHPSLPQEDHRSSSGSDITMSSSSPG
jgi:hypothetical protein